MKKKARKAFEALKKIGANVYHNGDPVSACGLFVISAEAPFADYYHDQVREHEDGDGNIVNAFGISQKVHDILDANDLHAEWVNPDMIAVYDWDL